MFKHSVRFIRIPDSSLIAAINYCNANSQCNCIDCHEFPPGELIKARYCCTYVNAIPRIYDVQDYGNALVITVI